MISVSIHKDEALHVLVQECQSEPIEHEQPRSTTDDTATAEAAFGYLGQGLQRVLREEVTSDPFGGTQMELRGGFAAILEPVL